MGLLTVDQVAERLAVKPETVREWLRQGKLNGIQAGRLWRVTEQELERFMTEGSIKQQSSNLDLDKAELTSRVRALWDMVGEAQDRERASNLPPELLAAVKGKLWEALCLLTKGENEWFRK